MGEGEGEGRGRRMVSKGDKGKLGEARWWWGRQGGGKVETIFTLTNIKQTSG